jgi:hypothetical protein
MPPTRPPRFAPSRAPFTPGPGPRAAAGASNDCAHSGPTVLMVGGVGPIEAGAAAGEGGAISTVGIDGKGLNTVGGEGGAGACNAGIAAGPGVDWSREGPGGRTDIGGEGDIPGVPSAAPRMPIGPSRLPFAACGYPRWAAAAESSDGAAVSAFSPNAARLIGSAVNSEPAPQGEAGAS